MAMQNETQGRSFDHYDKNTTCGKGRAGAAIAGVGEIETPR